MAKVKTLEPQIGLGGVIAVSIGAMLGSGIFVLPGIAYAQTGPSAWLAYLASALCVLPAAVSKSELATAMPNTGGTYVYLERTFGPLAGTVAGFGLGLSLLLKSAFALVGFGAYLSVLADVPLQLTAMLLLGVIILLNILGVGKASGALVGIVIVSVTGLAALTAFGALNFDINLMRPLYARGADGFIAATAIVFVSFAGVTKVAAIAEEVKKPEVNLPRGILISLSVVTLIYCGVNFVLVGNLPGSVLANDLKPIHSLAELLGGKTIGIITAIISILTMTSMANAGILAASRFPFAMSRDNLLPKFLGTLSSKYLTPVYSILMSGAIVGICLLFLDVVKIAKLASSFLIMIYVFESLAVIILRETRVQWYKPRYKSVLYPWLQVFGILAGVFLLFNMGGIVVTALVTISIPGLLVFFFYSRKRTVRRGVVGVRGRRKDLTEESEASLPQAWLNFLDFSKHASVVVSLFGKERSPEVLIELGVALSDGGKLEVTRLTEVPEQTTLSDMREEGPAVRALRRRIHAMSDKHGIEIELDTIVSHDIYKSINDISRRLACQWLVTEWGGKTRGALTIHDPIGWLRDHLSCHLAIFRDAGVRYIRRILVVIHADQTDRLVIKTGEHLAKVYGGSMTFAKYVPPECSQERIEHEREFLLRSGQTSGVQVDALVMSGKTFVSAVVSTSVEFDLVVFGASRGSNRWKTVFGDEHDKIMAGAACSVVSVQPAKKAAD